MPCVGRLGPFAKGLAQMADNDNQATLDAIVHRLQVETGISKSQALELISLLGLNWSSLMRDAKVIKGQPIAHSAGYR